MKKLEVGQEVLLFKTKKGRLIRCGLFTINNLLPRFIVLDSGRYRVSIQVFDLRNRLYILRDPGGQVIKFKPIEKQHVRGPKARKNERIKE